MRVPDDDVIAVLQHSDTGGNPRSVHPHGMTTDQHMHPSGSTHVWNQAETSAGNGWFRGRSITGSLMDADPLLPGDRKAQGIPQCQPLPGLTASIRFPVSFLIEQVRHGCGFQSFRRSRTASSEPARGRRSTTGTSSRNRRSYKIHADAGERMRNEETGSFTTDCRGAEKSVRTGFGMPRVPNLADEDEKSGNWNNPAPETERGHRAAASPVRASELLSSGQDTCGTTCTKYREMPRVSRRSDFRSYCSRTAGMHDFFLSTWRACPP
jgi:hypothetical protein